MARSFGFVPLTPRRSKAIQAKRVAALACTTPEEVFRRWRLGQHWCSRHGFENAEASCRQGKAFRIYRAHAEGKCAQCLTAPAGPRSTWYCEPCRVKREAWRKARETAKGV